VLGSETQQALVHTTVRSSCCAEAPARASAEHASDCSDATARRTRAVFPLTHVNAGRRPDRYIDAAGGDGPV